MANILVRRDQFNITPQGIIHKPTDAAFTPYPGDPYLGAIERLDLALLDDREHDGMLGR